MGSDYCSQAWDRVLTVLSPYPFLFESLMCLHKSSDFPGSSPPLVFFLSSFAEVEGSCVSTQLPGVGPCAAESTAHSCPCRFFLYFLSPQAVPVAASSASGGLPPLHSLALLLSFPGLRCLMPKDCLRFNSPPHCLGRLPAALDKA